MNRLANESSPYLLQHADNPVDWYPWGEEAFAKARAEDKPILLSVGYSSCHWCHVMAHESFEDEAIAAQMNEGFVNIKVDREERPDVDSVYMTFTQAMSGSGGWPMTVFLTPDLEPFYAGTYFPPDDRYGRPGFPKLLEGVSRAWRENRASVVESAQDLTAKVREATGRQTEGGSGAIAAATSEAAFKALEHAFDPHWGGFGRAPKFPSASNLEFLLMYGARTGEDAPTAMALHTCRMMAAGGMYDHLGGGFARYSVDAQWLVPHFEKMLYDNALLARLYAHAYQVSSDGVGGDEAFATVVRETLDYLLREMLDAGGGFHSAQDADSEGIEGKFFVWTPAEIAAVLGPEDGAAFCAVYAVTEDGNFEDPHHPEFGRRNVLSRPEPLEAVAERLARPAAELEAALPAWRQQLFEERARRVPPGLDDKVLTSWNGLAISAFAEAGRILGEPRYVEAARRTAEFIRTTMVRDGRLMHSYRAETSGTGEAKVDALLEDYAYLGLGLVDLYRATGDLGLIEWATTLYEDALARFADTDGTFFESPSDGESLILRQKPFFDSPTPSGNASMAILGFWLARYLGRTEWEDASRAVITSVAGQFTRGATGFGAMLQALELQLATPREIVVVGTPSERAPFEREISRRYLPAVLLAPARTGGGLPVLEGRSAGTGATAYVCENMVCDLPATSVSAFVEQLDH
ncbi:MAG: thioredoxin domain-containing protein [Dehalococcoidia bacterium]|nr:thioredoxin domain-containing protein [Dehalococcoidia bacterium]